MVMIIEKFGKATLVCARDTGLFIMSESLLKNALGANHQDINGKRSFKTPSTTAGAASAYSEDSLQRRPNKSSQTWTTF